MASSSTPQTKEAYVTLLTRSSYLPGVLALSYTLHKQGATRPLLVLVTPSLPSSSLRALEIESMHNPLLTIHPTNPLLPPASQPTTLIAARFEDTWTKLRVFELTSYTTLIYLDADMTILQNIEYLFSHPLPGSDWLAANHACVCNLDKDSWADRSWIPKNCAYTPLSHSSSPTPVPPTSSSSGIAEHRLLNSGMFIFHPSPALWTTLLTFFQDSPRLSTYNFPDQDFLADFFIDKWQSLGWEYNALKTMRYWHENIWRDDQVKVLHYIVDKPWERRIASDGVAGHLGRDEVTHRWWWDEWEEWRAARRGESELLGIVDDLIPGELDEEGDGRQVKENREKGLPIPVPPHPGMIRGSDS